MPSRKTPGAKIRYAVVGQGYIAQAAVLPAFAHAKRNSVLAVHPFKTMYAAPLVTLGYAAKIPPATTHIEGLTISTTAQIYPQDRGMNEAIHTGVRAAAMLLARQPQSTRSA